MDSQQRYRAGGVIVGGVLSGDLEPSALWEVAPWKYEARHRVILNAIFTIGEVSGGAIDLASVYDQLIINGTLDIAGGATYLAETVADYRGEDVPGSIQILSRDDA